MANEAHLSDDKAKKAMVDAARLADELRNEQEIAQSFEKDRKLLECQLKDMHTRLDETEVKVANFPWNWSKFHMQVDTQTNNFWTLNIF